MCFAPFLLIVLKLDLEYMFLPRASLHSGPAQLCSCSRTNAGFLDAFARICLSSLGAVDPWQLPFLVCIAAAKGTSFVLRHANKSTYATINALATLASLIAEQLCNSLSSGMSAVEDVSHIAVP